MSTRRQLPGKISGTNPLIYTGSTPNVFIETRRPTTKDYIGYEIGTQWIIPKKAADAPASAPSQEFWFLVSKSNNMGIWKRLRGGGSPASTLSVNIRVFDTPGSGTYIPTEGMTECIVECQGGGSGASSASTDGASNSFAGYSGSSGGYCKRFFTAIEGGAPLVIPSGGNAGAGGGYCKKIFTAFQIGASQAYVIGSGGVPGLTGSRNGGNGSVTTFGSPILLTANGGNGGMFDFDPAGSPGGISSGGDINIEGQRGSAYYNYSISVSPGVNNNLVKGGMGGNSFLGIGGAELSANFLDTISPFTISGDSGTGYGSGAGGGIVTTNLAINGTQGSDGAIIITEYIE